MRTAQYPKTPQLNIPQLTETQRGGYAATVTPIPEADTDSGVFHRAAFHGAAFNRSYSHNAEDNAEEIAKAQASVQGTNVAPHDSDEWTFTRSLPMAMAGFSNSRPDTLLPTVSPVARLSFFAPPADDSFRTIMLDPGHGGSDPGTIGPQGQLEKVLTLDIAKRIQHLLAHHPNIDVQLTRQDDKGYSRNTRMHKVRAIQPDILVSLHLNNLPQKDLTLVESYYAARENILESELGRALNGNLVKTRHTQSDYQFANESKRLAELLQGHLFHQVSQGNPDAINAGTKKETLYMLTQTYVPATLIELTCLSNSFEEQRLITPEYRQELAMALAKGILEFFATQNTNLTS